MMHAHDNLVGAALRGRRLLNVVRNTPACSELCVVKTSVGTNNRRRKQFIGNQTASSQFATDEDNHDAVDMADAAAVDDNDDMFENESVFNFR